MPCFSHRKDSLPGPSPLRVLLPRIRFPCLFSPDDHLNHEWTGVYHYRPSYHRSKRELCRPFTAKSTADAVGKPKLSVGEQEPGQKYLLGRVVNW